MSVTTMVYNGSKPYEQMDDLGGFPIFLVQHPHDETLLFSQGSPPGFFSHQLP